MVRIYLGLVVHMRDYAAGERPPVYSARYFLLERDQVEYIRLKSGSMRVMKKEYFRWLI